MTKPDFNQVITNKIELAIIIESMGEYIKSVIETTYFQTYKIYKIHNIYRHLVDAYYKEYASWGNDLSFEYYKLAERIDEILLDNQRRAVERAFDKKQDDQNSI